MRVWTVYLQGSPYTFSVKPKGLFSGFSPRTTWLQPSFARPLRGHSTVGVPNRCKGFMEIWLRAREEFVDNRFQLLFIYNYID